MPGAVLSKLSEGGLSALPLVGPIRGREHRGEGRTTRAERPHVCRCGSEHNRR